MSPQKSSAKRKKPKATRPHMQGYGITEKKAGMLPWKWASDRLSKSRQYWIATTRPDGSPHVMIVWGLWFEDEFWFSTGRKSRKARNLAGNPRCVICSDNSGEAVIVEGEAELVDNPAALKKLFAAYKKKYKIDVSGMGEPMYRVRPRVAFGLYEKKFTQTATRWLF
jgi:PPOX class probable F420-dependent enzyme